MPDTSRPPPDVHGAPKPRERIDNIAVNTPGSWRNSDSQNRRAINVLQASDFISDLCWDVEGIDVVSDPTTEDRIISPRMRVSVQSREISALIDSGSDITCVSEQFYESMKSCVDMPVLPVSNLVIFVAAGRKTITIRKMVQITIKFWKFEITHAYLVVPGLTTDVIIGVDFLKKYGGVINFKNETFKLWGEKIPSDLICYKLSDSSQITGDDACYSLRLRLIDEQNATVNPCGLKPGPQINSRYNINMLSLGGA